MKQLCWSHRLSGGKKKLINFFCELSFGNYSKTVFKLIIFLFYLFTENFKNIYLYYSFQSLYKNKITLVIGNLFTRSSKSSF